MGNTDLNKKYFEKQENVKYWEVAEVLSSLYLFRVRKVLN